MQNFRKFLLPFSWLYQMVTGLRNKMYDTGMLESRNYSVPVICVGNLSVGGTGKSPMVEFLIALLSNRFSVATLSRGYKRTTKGFLLVQGIEKAHEVGDEPLQFKKKFPDIVVAVDEVRTRGIENLLNLSSPPDVIVLDDAFQHRKVKAGLNILLTAYDNLYFEDDVLPAGNLRESQSGRNRAHIVVVTKCPLNLTPKAKDQIARSLELTSKQSLFFTGIGYSQQVYNETGASDLSRFDGKAVTLVTGIANPQPLVNYLKSKNLIFEHLDFPDHHRFTNKELDNIRSKELILTTEKDYMRLLGEIPPSKLYYLPISTLFLDKEEAFKSEVLAYVTKK